MWNPKSEGERKPCTLYPDLPPEALLVQSGGKNVTVDRDEYLRAQWFWERRPAKLILSPHKAWRMVTLFLVLWIASMFVPQQAQATAAVHGLAWTALAMLGVAVFVDISRYAQWKWEYSCAMTRLFAAVHR
jgi:hypothetical protein